MNLRLFQSFAIKLPRWRSAVTRNWVGGVIGAVISAGTGVILGFVHFGSEVPLGQTLIHWSYDLPFAMRRDIKPEGVVIIYMDEDSFNALGQHYSKPWDRALHARLLKRLKDEGARIVVMDIVFSEPAPEAADKELIEALKAHGKVVIGAEYIRTGIQDEAAGWRVEWPLFRDDAACGLVQLIGEPDFGVRQHFPGGFEGADFVPSLPWKAAQLVRAEITRIPSQQGRERWINYYGPPRSLPHVSYHLASKPDGVPPGFFKDKVVFIGELPPRTGLPGSHKEEHRTPYTYWTGEFSSGVEIQATAFLNLVRKDWLVRFPGYAEFVLLTLAGVLVGYGLILFRPIPAAGLSLAAMAALSVFAWFLAWKWHLWFAWLLVVGVQIPLAFLWSALFNSMKLYIDKRVLQRTLELHLSPQRVKQILKRPELLRPGAEKQEVSILFSDIANFSTVTARMDPDDLFRLLNRYFQESLACIHQTDGTVIKLVGDAIFAVWNAPFVQPDQQERACRAALLLRDQLIRFDASSHGLPLCTRVGLHTGFAYVGNVGSADRFDYTAVGDPINVASRLEGLNKHLGTEILATRDIQKVVETTLVSRLVGHFRFKGFDRVLEVHELIGTAEQAEPTRLWRETFEGALHHFQRRNFEAAGAEFGRTLQLRPNDGPASFYLGKIHEFRSQQLPPDWAGEVTLAEK